MQATDLFSIFIERFKLAEINYMIVGSIAAMVYGEPRITHDIDVVAKITEKDLPKLIELFPSGEFYCPEHEIILIELSRKTRGHFNIIHHDTGFKADIYLIGEESELNRKRVITFGGQDIFIAAPEDVIIKKLEFYKEGGSEKHIRDIAKMLNISGEKIDLSLLENLITKKYLKLEWEKVLTEVAKSI